MRIRSITCLVAALTAISSAAAADQEQAPSQSFRVVLPAPEDAWLQCTLRIAAGPASSKSWDDWFGELFEYFDVDHSGTLNAAEASRAPDPRLLAAQLRGDFYNLSAKTVDWNSVRPSAAAAAGGDALTPAQFRDVYRRAGLALPEVRLTWTDRSDLATHRLLTALGDARSGGIGPARFQESERLLAPLDADDDQRIGWEELVDHAPAASAKPAAASQSETPPRVLVLDGSRKQRPDPLSEVAVSLSPNESGSVAVARAGDNRGSAGMQAAADGSVLVCGPGACIRVGAARGMATTALRTAQQSLVQQFQADDANGDGELDADERRASPTADYWTVLTAIADRDADGKLAVGELRGYLEVLARAAGCCVVLHAESAGRCLFETLDQDFDGRLSLRELRSGWRAVAAWDTNRSGTVEWDEIPRGWRLAFSIGQPRVVRAATSQPTAAPVGPRWFQALDTNLDGDVSRREFPGTADAFRQIDQDGDGLIDADEAAAAPRP